MSTATLFMEPPKPMICDKGETITPELILGYIEQHKKECVRYQKLMDLYIGKHDILNQKSKEDGKPDNRVVVNMPKYITDTFMGFFNGIPIKKKHQDDKTSKIIAEFDDVNDIENLEYELAKQACIQGRSYEYMYQDEDTKTRLTYFSADEMFIVYDNTVKQQPLFAVRYVDDEDAEKFTGELIKSDGYFELTKDDKKKLSIS